MALQTTPFACQRDGPTIRGMVYRPTGNHLPAVILSHGFGGTGSGLIRYGATGI